MKKLDLVVNTADEAEVLSPDLKVVSSYQPSREVQARVLKFLIEQGEASCPSPSTSESRPPMRSKKV